MPVSTDLPVAPATGSSGELAALRGELRCILQHPAITPARRQAAELLMCQCIDVGRLGHWLGLAVTECGHWEERMLAADEAGNP